MVQVGSFEIVCNAMFAIYLVRQFYYDDKVRSWIYLLLEWEETLFSVFVEVLQNLSEKNNKLILMNENKLFIIFRMNGNDNHEYNAIKKIDDWIF